MNRIKEAIQQSVDVKLNLLHDATLLSSLEKSVEACLQSLNNGGKILFCGNGGSAADAQHLAAELSGRFYFDRPPLNAEALHVNTSFLTAVANDYSYDEVFARMLRAQGRPGDILIGLSTSGNSPNIIRAFEATKALRILCIAFTGQTGGKMKEYADILLNVPSTDTPRIQESHILLGHILCELIERRMFGKPE
ncbi:MAG: D-sedoheptulose 7-phosphate isomerase [Bacteroidales bacterium]|jgi:D-sedoheptulose 7-phosphate isomerase|nr:D-sedoheptulose 7-phosphate isomerase [Bacteroidales bacterium]